jgi:hypothetical protein
MSRTRVTRPIIALSVGAGLVGAAAPAAARPAPHGPPAWTIYGDVIGELVGAAGIVS